MNLPADHYSPTVVLLRAADEYPNAMIASDTDFPFGANDGERTAVLTESNTIAWNDVATARRAARADVATVADAQWTRALSYVARLKVPCVRMWASKWLDFCTVAGPRPVRHVGDAGKACRTVELALARLGVVDPDGFSYAAEERPPQKAEVSRCLSRCRWPVGG